MTKCIYCGQYNEEYKSCAFCGAPSSYNEDMESWKDLAKAGYRTPYNFTDIPSKKSYMSEVKHAFGGIVNIRNKPSFSGKIVGHMPIGSKVSPQEFREDWIKIGKNQWVKGSYVSYPIAHGLQLQ